jgi:hypothetical protein
MKRLALAITLACALSGTAMAGEIHSTGPEPASGITQGPGIAATVILTILSLVR